LSFVRHSKSINNVNGDLLGYGQQAFDIGANSKTAGLVRQGGKNYYDPQDGSMVACWLFDEGMGRTLYDRSTNGHHLNRAEGTIPGLATDGLEFEYSDLEWLDVNDFSHTFGEGDWTINTWIKLEDGVNYSHLFTADDQTDFACKIAKNTQSPVRYPYFYSSATGGVASSVGLNLAVWHMMTYRRVGDQISVLVDGALTGTGSANGLNVTVNDFQIGKFNTEGFDGIMHSMVIYSTGLPNSIISSIHDAGMYHTPERLSYVV